MIDLPVIGDVIITMWRHSNEMGVYLDGIRPKQSRKRSYYKFGQRTQYTSISCLRDLGDICSQQIYDTADLFFLNFFSATYKNID